MGGRVVDCARLESVYAARHPGFESPPIRQRFHFNATARAIGQCLTMDWVRGNSGPPARGDLLLKLESFSEWTIWSSLDPSVGASRGQLRRDLSAATVPPCVADARGRRLNRRSRCRRINRLSAQRIVAFATPRYPR